MEIVRLTTRELADTIERRHGGAKIPMWKMRRILDDMESRELISIQRAGGYRIISDDDIPVVVEELRRIGRLPKEEVAPC